MESTALITFLFKAPPGTWSVELLGSWDNFARPYRMGRDKPRGSGYWSGCHRFESIICDGHRADWSRPRTGALKQGGRYWYYYRVDDSQELCDSSQPSSSTCPLLPGQRVNVLDVPVEVREVPQRVSSACANATMMRKGSMTLEPQDRYKKIYRQSPTKLPRLYCSTDALREMNTDRSFYIHDGPVSPPLLRRESTSPTEMLKMKRVRRREPDAESLQQPGSCDVIPSQADLERLIPSSFSDEMTALPAPALRPFGPSAFQDHGRPSSRFGLANTPNALGLVFDEYDLLHFASDELPESSDSASTADSEDEARSSPLTMKWHPFLASEPPAHPPPHWPLSPSSDPVTPSSASSSRLWPLMAPNPLQKGEIMFLDDEFPPKVNATLSPLLDSPSSLALHPCAISPAIATPVMLEQGSPILGLQGRKKSSAGYRSKAIGSRSGFADLQIPPRTSSSSASTKRPSLAAESDSLKTPRPDWQIPRAATESFYYSSEGEESGEAEEDYNESSSEERGMQPEQDAALLSLFPLPPRSSSLRPVSAPASQGYQVAEQRDSVLESDTPASIPREEKNKEDASDLEEEQVAEQRDSVLSTYFDKSMTLTTSHDHKKTAPFYDEVGTRYEAADAEGYAWEEEDEDEDALEDFAESVFGALGIAVL